MSLRLREPLAPPAGSTCRVWRDAISSMMRIMNAKPERIRLSGIVARGSKAGPVFWHVRLQISADPTPKVSLHSSEFDLLLEDGRALRVARTAILIRERKPGELIRDVPVLRGWRTHRGTWGELQGLQEAKYVRDFAPRPHRKVELGSIVIWPSERIELYGELDGPMPAARVGGYRDAACSASTGIHALIIAVGPDQRACMDEALRE